MTPAEALSHLTKGDPERIVPAVYRKMSRKVLHTLVREIGSDANRQGAAPSAAPAGPEPAGLAAPGLAPSPVQTLLQRAIARPGRLRTPARRRVALLQYYAGCRTLIEAAARAGIDRRTINRWRQASPAFDRRLNRVVTDRREDAFEQALLVAGRPTIRPVYYRGQKVSEYEVPNTALALYLMKQADREAERASQRSLPSKKAEAEARTMSFGESVDEGLRRAREMRRRQDEDARRHSEEAAESRQMSHPSEDATPHSPGHSESPAAGAPHAWDGDAMSHPPGHWERRGRARPRVWGGDPVEYDPPVRPATVPRVWGGE